MKRKDVPPTHRLTATAPLLPRRLPMPHGTCAVRAAESSGSSGRLAKTAMCSAARVWEATRTTPSPRANASAASHLALEGSSSAFSMLLPASCLRVDTRRVGAFGRAARPRRSLPLSPERLSGSSRVRSAARSLESQPPEARAVSCGTTKTAL
eukprot:scaffold71682_cov63-Phaeocystis_antarctica.AAC.1